MKSLTAKTLTTAAVLGAALLGIVGTAQAANLLPGGANVVGEGFGATESTAIANAVTDARRQCASGEVNGRPGGKATAGQWFDGTWKATYTTTCLPSPLGI